MSPWLTKLHEMEAATAGRPFRDGYAVHVQQLREGARCNGVGDLTGVIRVVKEPILEVNGNRFSWTVSKVNGMHQWVASSVSGQVRPGAEE